jgi:hypothetical protein
MPEPGESRAQAYARGCGVGRALRMFSETRAPLGEGQMSLASA